MEQELKAEEAEFEVVASADIGNGGDYSVVATVELPGVLKTNFEALLPAVKAAMEKYKGVTATEGNLAEVYEMRARLRKAKDALKKEWKRAKAEFNKPLEVPEGMYNELVEVLEGTIDALDESYKAIDGKLRRGRYEGRGMRVRSIVEESLTIEEQIYFRNCDPAWMENPRWENKTYADKDLKADADRVSTAVHTAWATFDGPFRQQMLDIVASTGNVALALSEGQRLKEQAEAYAEAERMRAEREAQRKAEIARRVTGTADSAPREGDDSGSVVPGSEQRSGSGAGIPGQFRGSERQGLEAAAKQGGTDPARVCVGAFRMRGFRAAIEEVLTFAAERGVECEKLCSADGTSRLWALPGKEDEVNG